jgi:hypothetical protein
MYATFQGENNAKQKQQFSENVANIVFNGFIVHGTFVVIFVIRSLQLVSFTLPNKLLINFIVKKLTTFFFHFFVLCNSISRNKNDFRPPCWKKAF